MSSLLQFLSQENKGQQSRRKWVWNPCSIGYGSMDEEYPHSQPLAALQLSALRRPAKLHRRVRSVRQPNELEQLALDVRAEKRLWKEAVARAERTKVARSPTPRMASIPEDEVVQQIVGGWSRMKASIAEGSNLSEKVSILPSLPEQDEAEEKSPSEQLFGDEGSDMSDIVFADPAFLGEAASLSPRTIDISLPVPTTPPTLRRTRLRSIQTLKEYPSISTMVFADPDDIEDSASDTEYLTLTPRPVLKRVVRRIDEWRRVRPASLVVTSGLPGSESTSPPWHPPFCFESFGCMASLLLCVSPTGCDLDQPTTKVSGDAENPVYALPPEPEQPAPSLLMEADHSPAEQQFAGGLNSVMTMTEETDVSAEVDGYFSKRQTVLLLEQDMAGMEGQIADLTCQLSDAMLEIVDLLAELHAAQDTLLVTAREVRNLQDDLQFVRRINLDLRAENKSLRQDIINIHNSATSVHPKSRPSRYLDFSHFSHKLPGSEIDTDSCSIMSSFSGTPQLSSGISSLPTTPDHHHAPAPAEQEKPINSEIPGPGLSIESVSLSRTPAQPSFTVHIHNEEELEGLEVDLGDMKQIPQLFDETLPTERSLMREDSGVNEYLLVRNAALLSRDAP
ncbi:hypothetical protein HWV62_22572 [Athelia sp. TMB]|nr:hypothetical protein HWV62_22572 [Athelia sp. TMB]